jgi:hypothetical protein
VNYDTSLLERNKEISSYIFNGAKWSKLTIKEFSNPAYQAYVKVGQTMTIERYRNLSFTAVLDLETVEYQTNEERFKFSWPVVEGAEEYDFEWTWIDAIDDNNQVLPVASVDNVNFKFNSSRITTSSTEAYISRVYEQGYIVARVRAVGRNKDKIDQVTTGKWSDDGNTAMLSTYTANKDYILIQQSGTHKPLNNNMNWQYVASFAEEGKNKEVISYYDGSLRNRQSVTRISSTMEAVVGETVYDFEGRPSVNILPVPSFDSKLSFHEAFNISQETNKAYSKEDFDNTPTAICGVDVAALKNSSGASRYYSSNNANVSERHAGYIPDSEGYPMTVTEYMPDGTGRIKRQGGVGTAHQIGTNHETKYYYGTPSSQAELDRLFGNNVGFVCSLSKRNGGGSKWTGFRFIQRFKW